MMMYILVIAFPCDRLPWYNIVHPECNKYSMSNSNIPKNKSLLMAILYTTYNYEIINYILEVLFFNYFSK